ncbi:MAG TPA: LuxR C-terminal-related transcriptional regulator [Rhizobiaceae bacterium]|nr:LuxR C-terminal-related transcriptional regulator [Rhizobiaceae bacterium]
MAQPNITIALAIADPARLEELTAALSEERDIALADASDHANVVVTDGTLRDAVTPHVAWGVDPTGQANVRATLEDGAGVSLVIAAIRLAAAGYRMERSGPSEEAKPGWRYHLSTREREVLALLAEGAPNKVIARRLGISVHTAKFHVAAVVGKLGAANRTEAIGIAMREGLVLI